jgi:hypothetical protein
LYNSPTVVCVILVMGSGSVGAATVTSMGADSTPFQLAVSTVTPPLPVGTSVEPSEATPEV